MNAIEEEVLRYLAADARYRKGLSKEPPAPLSDLAAALLERWKREKEKGP